MRQLRFNLFISLLFIIPSIIWAGNNDTISSSKEFDTTYIISYRDLLHITVVGVNKQTGITLANVNSDYDLAFKSNNPLFSEKLRKYKSFVESKVVFCLTALR